MPYDNIVVDNDDTVKAAVWHAGVLACTPDFQDLFFGTGLLSAHTPDIAPGTFAWVADGAGTMTLDGAGLVVPTTDTITSYTADNSIQGWSDIAIGTNFSVIITALLPE
jgi:hypothetical protein